MRTSILLILVCLTSGLAAQEPGIIPKPVKTEYKTGSYLLTPKTVLLVTDEGEKHSADFLNMYLQQYYGFSLKTVKEAGSNFIRLSTKRFIAPPPEGKYSMTVTPSGISIDGDTYQGTFYGVQTLIQLLPVQPAAEMKIPCVAIEDYPRFEYRGLHLDVSRHFFSVDFIRKYIDYIALHKMNYFHWHLTDDQGWRIEIKKYPKLTEIGACRDGTIIGRYPGTGNDNIKYCGYYTQDQVREVVKYAADRYVTIIPEIEMPGHAVAALASYPELGCTGGPYKVKETWGVFEEVFCAGNEKTFQFLQDVLDEVMPLFPAKYVHIGGDECPKTSWQKCPKCQQRMKDNHLKDEHELQSYFIQRMEKYVNSKGKQIIGWDEILEGGLAPNATVMSWRGEKGGIEAAKAGHLVIMTPGSHVYFDHTQTRNEDSVTIGGYTPLEKTYSYEPVPKELTEAQHKYVLGAQANLWSEYIKNTKKVEYMIFPRLSALSEVLWSRKEDRNWEDFEKRLTKLFKRYELWGTNYSKAYYGIKATVTPASNNTGLLWTLDSKVLNNNNQILISSGDNVTVKKKYEKPILVNGSSVYTATLLLNNPDGKKEECCTFVQRFYYNKATGKKVTVTKDPSSAYPGQGGAFGLINGMISEKGISSPEWLGWNGTDMEATIDLGKPQTISTVNIHSVESPGSRIYPPQIVEVFVSGNGKNFTPAGKSSTFIPDKFSMGNITVTLTPSPSRFVKVVAKNAGKIPEGKPGSGENAWLFVDEIQVN